MYIKVSVIIPVYNVERYLSKCLDSVINQSLKEIEIICINDCSTDSSLSILNNYSEKDSRIKIINNDINIGLGPTRNVGINNALGEYIAFIDSDDYISLDFLDRLYKTAKKYNSDIANTLNIITDENGLLRKYILYLKKKEFRSNWSLHNIDNYFVSENIISYVWNKLYKRDFLVKNKLLFMNIKFGCEDSDFTIRLMAYKPNISFNNKVVYYYRIRKGSLIDIARNNIESSINALKHMQNVILFYKDNFPQYLNIIYSKVWFPAISFYLANNKNNKIEIYDSIKSFASNIYISESFINKRSKYETRLYNEYLSIIGSNNYNDYLLKYSLLNRLNLIEEQLLYNDNYFKIVAFNNSLYYFNIIIFGIKISIKKRIL